VASHPASVLRHLWQTNAVKDVASVTLSQTTTLSMATNLPQDKPMEVRLLQKPHLHLPLPLLLPLPLPPPHPPQRVPNSSLVLAPQTQTVLQHAVDLLLASAEAQLSHKNVMEDVDSETHSQMTMLPKHLQDGALESEGRATCKVDMSVDIYIFLNPSDSSV
jgi:hypothetical protein